MVHLYTIFMVSPIFFPMAGTGKDVIEAARDISAGKFQGFKKVTLPIIMPGVFECEKVCAMMLRGLPTAQTVWCDILGYRSSVVHGLE